MWRTNFEVAEFENTGAEKQNHWGPLDLFRRVTGKGDDLRNPDQVSYLHNDSPRLTSRLARPTLMQSLPNIRESSRASSALTGYPTGTEARAWKISGPRTAIPREDFQDRDRGVRAVSETGRSPGGAGITTLNRVPKRGSPGITPSRPIRSILKWKKPDIAPTTLAPPQGSGQTIPTRGQSSSPIRREAANSKHSVPGVMRTPSRTFIRIVKPVDIIEVPEIKHPRLSLRTVVGSPLFIGGATIEGEVRVIVENKKSRRARRLQPVLLLERATIDLLGIETCNGNNHVFRSLAMELIDDAHPPPAAMVVSTKVRFDQSWELIPSNTKIPFRLNLPIDMGPPPYRSRHADIRYVLCTTMTLQIEGRRSHVRDSQEIPILTVHDPETALLNLPFPLTASNALIVSKDYSPNDIELTAGVHRQTWVSGMALFVDVRITNRTRKAVKRIELQLERATTFFRHSTMGTSTLSAGHFRLPDRTERKVVASNVYRNGRYGRRCMLAQYQNEITLGLDIPSGLVTISTGCFFGVRYFLSVVLHLTSTYKQLHVEIPVNIIHPNSLDILPNSLAQVASALEHVHRHKVAYNRSDHNRTGSASYRGPDSDRLKTHKSLDDIAGLDNREYTDTWDYTPNTSPHSSPMASPLLPPSLNRTQNAPLEHTNYKYIPGSAFSAPRRQSLEEIRRCDVSNQVPGHAPSTDQTGSMGAKMNTKGRRRVSFSEPDKAPTALPEASLYRSHDKSAYQPIQNSAQRENITTSDEIASLTRALDGSPRKMTTKKGQRRLDGADKEAGMLLSNATRVVGLSRSDDVHGEDSPSYMADSSNDQSVLVDTDDRHESEGGVQGLPHVYKKGGADGSGTGRTNTSQLEPSTLLQKNERGNVRYEHGRNRHGSTSQNIAPPPTTRACLPSATSGVDLSIFGNSVTSCINTTSTRKFSHPTISTYMGCQDDGDIPFGDPGPDVGELELANHDVLAIRSPFERDRCSAGNQDYVSNRSSNRSKSKGSTGADGGHSGRIKARHTTSSEYLDNADGDTTVIRGRDPHHVGLGRGGRLCEEGPRHKLSMIEKGHNHKYRNKEDKVERSRGKERREGGDQSGTYITSVSEHSKENYDRGIGKARGKRVADGMHV